MAGRTLRTREQVDGLLMPIAAEGATRVLDKADAEEAIHSLDNRGGRVTHTLVSRATRKVGGRTVGS